MTTTRRTIRIDAFRRGQWGWFALHAVPVALIALTVGPIVLAWYWSGRRFPRWWFNRVWWWAGYRGLYQIDWWWQRRGTNRWWLRGVTSTGTCDLIAASVRRCAEYEEPDGQSWEWWLAQDIFRDDRGARKVPVALWALHVGHFRRDVRVTAEQAQEAMDYAATVKNWPESAPYPIEVVAA